MRTPGPKKSTPRRADLAEGGETKMFGKGDRTKTATTDAAGEQTPGRTEQKSRGNPKFAEGGSRHGMVARQAAEPANPGQTGTKETPANSKRASGGISRPARPGECGT